MQGQDKVKARPKPGQGEGEFKVRLRQRKHNLNHNNNLMGFDTIEINLVYLYICKPQKLYNISDYRSILILFHT